MEKTLWKRKRFLSIGIIVAALWAGALVRASHYEAPLSSEVSSERTISLTEISRTSKDQHPPAEAELLLTVLGASFDERGARVRATPRPARGASSGKNPSKQDDPVDFQQIKKDIRPINRPPGDMNEYLDEAEKARREGIRKSLKDIRKKVKEWEKSIFEPTW